MKTQCLRLLTVTTCKNKCHKQLVTRRRRLLEVMKKENKELPKAPKFGTDYLETFNTDMKNRKK